MVSGSLLARMHTLVSKQLHKIHFKLDQNRKIMVQTQDKFCPVKQNIRTVVRAKCVANNSATTFASVTFAAGRHGRPQNVRRQMALFLY